MSKLVKNCKSLFNLPEINRCPTSCLVYRTISSLVLANANMSIGKVVEPKHVPRKHCYGLSESLHSPYKSKLCHKF